jgi:hypothetical protein
MALLNNLTFVADEATATISKPIADRLNPATD